MSYVPRISTAPSSELVISHDFSKASKESQFVFKNHSKTHYPVMFKIKCSKVGLLACKPKSGFLEANEEVRVRVQVARFRMEPDAVEQKELITIKAAFLFDDSFDSAMSLSDMWDAVDPGDVVEAKLKLKLKSSREEDVNDLVSTVDKNRRTANPLLPVLKARMTSNSAASSDEEQDADYSENAFSPPQKSPQNYLPAGEECAVVGNSRENPEKPRMKTFNCDSKQRRSSQTGVKHSPASFIPVKSSSSSTNSSFSYSNGEGKPGQQQGSSSSSSSSASRSWKDRKRGINHENPIQEEQKVVEKCQDTVSSRRSDLRDNKKYWSYIGNVAIFAAGVAFSYVLFHFTK